MYSKIRVLFLSIWQLSFPIDCLLSRVSICRSYLYFYNGLNILNNKHYCMLWPVVAVGCAFNGKMHQLQVFSDISMSEMLQIELGYIIYKWCFGYFLWRKKSVPNSIGVIFAHTELNTSWQHDQNIINVVQTLGFSEIRLVWNFFSSLRQKDPLFLVKLSAGRVNTETGETQVSRLR